MGDCAGEVLAECRQDHRVSNMPASGAWAIQYLVHTLALFILCRVDSAGGIADQLYPHIPGTDFLKVCLERPFAGTKHITPHRDTSVCLKLSSVSTQHHVTNC